MATYSLNTTIKFSRRVGDGTIAGPGCYIEGNYIVLGQAGPVGVITRWAGPGEAISGGAYTIYGQPATVIFVSAIEFANSP